MTIARPSPPTLFVIDRLVELLLATAPACSTQSSAPWGSASQPASSRQDAETSPQPASNAPECTGPSTAPTPSSPCDAQSSPTASTASGNEQHAQRRHSSHKNVVRPLRAMALITPLVSLPVINIQPNYTQSRCSCVGPRPNSAVVQEPEAVCTTRPFFVLLDSFVDKAGKNKRLTAVGTYWMRSPAARSHAPHPPATEISRPKHYPSGH